ncbi:MAG: helix-turn-helix domain-containing protein [Selenomonadaceae bacterium]|nr:helix-turn-helix domain-containing protein [Selenomonadaceae bacterium]
MGQEFLNAKQVAVEFFNGECNYMKVLRLTRLGVIPAKKFGKSYLFKRSELENWAADNFSRPAVSDIKLKGSDSR